MKTKRKNNWIIIRDEYTDEKKRYNLATMRKLDISQREGNYAQGVSLEEVYYMPRAKQVIIETYSIWENRQTHGCEGTSYSIATPETIANLAEYSGDDILMALVPVDSLS